MLIYFYLKFNLHTKSELFLLGYFDDRIAFKLFFSTTRRCECRYKQFVVTRRVLRRKLFDQFLYIIDIPFNWQFRNVRNSLV